MKLKRILSILSMACFFTTNIAIGQEDTTQVEEEDWSIYDNLDFADEGTKRFASVKIKG